MRSPIEPRRLPARQRRRAGVWTLALGVLIAASVAVRLVGDGAIWQRLCLTLIAVAVGALLIHGLIRGPGTRLGEGRRVW